LKLLGPAHPTGVGVEIALDAHLDRPVMAVVVRLEPRDRVPGIELGAGDARDVQLELLESDGRVDEAHFRDPSVRVAIGSPARSLRGLFVPSLGRVHGVR
jgi:hypothetical protein